MKTPEEIKKGLEVCRNGAECTMCPYLKDEILQCSDNLKSDIAAYIQQLEAGRSGHKVLFEKTFDELEAANTAIDGEQNCTNCAYGNAIGVEALYCYDCKWFTEDATRIKWTEEKRDEGH